MCLFMTFCLQGVSKMPFLFTLISFFSVHAESSPELKRIQAQLAVMLFPICIGSMVFSGLRAREEFIHKNKPTVFVTKGMAMVRSVNASHAGKNISR